MNNKIKLNVGRLSVRVSFWTRIYLLLTRQEQLPVSSLEFDGLTIELEAGIGDEAYKAQVENGYKMLSALGAYLKPYVTKAADMYFEGFNK